MDHNHFKVKNRIGEPIEKTRFAEQALVSLPPRAAKFTLEEWKQNNEQRCRNVDDQQHLADRIINECERVINETKDRSSIERSTSEHRIKQRISDIEFTKSELEVPRKEICHELEALGMYKVRLQDCLGSLETNALTVCRKCLMMRDGRLGIDLVVDQVDTALESEINTIIGGQRVLTRVLEQLNEQMRRLRATRYMLDRQLHYKQAAIDIDKRNLFLKPTDSSLSIYEGYCSLDPAQITAGEYSAYCANSICTAAKELSSARPFRLYTDTLLKQVTEDLRNAHDKCNHAFEKRIKDTILSKSKLEDMHHDTTKKIFDLKNTILQLKRAMSQKEGEIGLAHTRLGRRAQRMEGELVTDEAGQALLSECDMLRMNVEQLQQAHHEASAALRYLLQTQIQLEEDINVKLNTLKIDEVDCMTLRKTVDYHDY